MRHAICALSAVPVRKEPSDKSEMTTQLLFGDACTVIADDGGWSRIRNKADGYEGWVTAKMLEPMTEEAYAGYDMSAAPVVTCGMAFAYNVQTGACLLLSGGSLLPMFDSFSSVFSAGKDRFHIEKRYIESLSGRESPVDTSLRFLSTPYLWGGKNVFGMDCSGFMQVVFRMHGVQIARDASMQAGEGIAVDGLSQAVGGDLMFFGNEQGRITHVGMYMGNGKIIHNSGCVHVDSVDETGIFSHSAAGYTHRLACIRRLEAGF